MIAFLALSTQIASPTAEITLSDGRFEVKDAAISASVPLRTEPTPLDRAGGRLTIAYEGRVITFDKDGLGIKERNTQSYSRLPFVATSGELFTDDEIADNKQLISQARRKAEVSALSGYELVGSDLYLLLRWDDSDGAPWLEALLRLPLAEARPAAKLVGRMPGISFARSLVDDRLVQRGGLLATLTNHGDAWGLASHDPKSGEMSFVGLGQPVGTAAFTHGNDRAVAQTRTRYGTTLVGLADLQSGSFRYSAEIRGAGGTFVPPRYYRYARGTSIVLMNLESGAETLVPGQSRQESTPLGLLVWSPSDKPATATLLHSENFRRLASWPPPPAAPPARSGSKPRR